MSLLMWIWVYQWASSSSRSVHAGRSHTAASDTICKLHSWWKSARTQRLSYYKSTFYLFLILLFASSSLQNLCKSNCNVNMQFSRIRTCIKSYHDMIRASLLQLCLHVNMQLQILISESLSLDLCKGRSGANSALEKIQNCKTKKQATVHYIIWNQSKH